VNQPSESNDKLMAALSYPIPIVSFIILFTDMKNRPFLKFHAVQSLAVNIIIYIVYGIVSTVTVGFGAICFPVFFLITLWPAYMAYKGDMFNIPMITDFLKKQGWVS
jgi:uncharacterized protein